MNEVRNSTKKTARIVGVLLIVQGIIGFLINQVLLGPYTFANDYLTSVAAHSLPVNISMVLGIISGVISVYIATKLFPVFRQHNEVLTFTFLAFSVINFTTVVIDNVSIHSLLALSRQYVKAGSQNTDYFQALGTVAYATRLWTHWMTILIPCLSLSVFFYLLFRHRLVPRFISVLGFIGTNLMVSAILLVIFGKGSFLWLMVPFGLNQIFLSIWLIVKGFNTHEATSQPN
jgi:hypothetical protein